MVDETTKQPETAAKRTTAERLDEIETRQTEIIEVLAGVSQAGRYLRDRHAAGERL